MNDETRAALQAQTEARTELNALEADAPEEARSAALAALNEADAALLKALEGEQAEGPAPAELRSRILLANYLDAAYNERSIAGAEAELNQELRLADNVVPLEALEERADAVSPQQTDGDPLASGDVNTTTGPLLTRVFTATDTAFLGIGMPMVPPGERVYPVMTTGTEASMQARGSGPDSGAAKFATVNATPHRLTGRYVFDLEGVAELGGMLESTLRADLRTEMGFQLDSQILLGDGTGANVTGLLNAIARQPFPALSGAAKDPAQLDWNNAKSAVTSLLDGKFARMESDIRLLVGDSTYERLRAVYRTNAASSDQDAYQMLMALGARLRRSFLIPAQSAVLDSATKRTQDALWVAEPGAALAPVWQGITMIRDPYSNAKAGQVVLTAHMLFDFVVRRKDGFKRLALNPLDTAK